MHRPRHARPVRANLPANVMVCPRPSRFTMVRVMPAMSSRDRSTVLRIGMARARQPMQWLLARYAMEFPVRNRSTHPRCPVRRRKRVPRQSKNRARRPNIIGTKARWRALRPNSMEYAKRRRSIAWKRCLNHGSIAWPSREYTMNAPAITSSGHLFITPSHRLTTGDARIARAELPPAFAWGRFAFTAMRIVETSFCRFPCRRLIPIAVVLRLPEDRSGAKPSQI